MPFNWPYQKMHDDCFEIKLDDFPMVNSFLNHKVYNILEYHNMLLMIYQ